MAVTRRQFVAGMSALAASMGFSSAQVARITQALAEGPSWSFGPGKGNKPKVLWIGGAECTGCSISTLSLYEDALGESIVASGISTLDALGLATGPANVPGTLHGAGLNVDGDGAIVNIADVLVDILDLQYHQTVMGMGGDLAAQFLNDQIVNSASGDPFVLVVEGSTQANDKGGAWDNAGSHPWCEIGATDAGVGIYSDNAVEALASSAACAAVISIGQCASFGGYPSAVPPAFRGMGDNEGRQTGSMSTFEFLKYKNQNGAADKVINVPGCPPNPWWLVLTIVAWLVDFHHPGTLGILDENAKIIPGALDKSQRLKAVYPYGMHTAFCPRMNDFTNNRFATKPGEKGCLQLIGCKGPSTKTLCGLRGWNNQQPENRRKEVDQYGAAALAGPRGGNCVMGGHPCMACTEDGYPDRFVPFIPR